MSQVMVRMVHAAVKFPQIHTLRRRCLRVLRGRWVLRARVEARELELGPRAGLRGRRCERGLWLRVRRYSRHRRRLNQGFRFGHMGLDRNMFVDLRDDLIQSTGHVEQRAGVWDVVDLAEVLLHIRYHQLRSFVCKLCPLLSSSGEILVLEANRYQGDFSFNRAVDLFQARLGLVQCCSLDDDEHLGVC